MNSLQWFYEMYSSGKMTLDMYKEILGQELERKEKDVKEIKEEMERISKEK